MSAQELLDLSKPIDVGVLDATINAFLGGTHNEEERAAADQILRKLQEHPDAWRQVHMIIERTNNLHTKYFALQILEGLVNYRWGALPEEQQEGLKNYVSNLIVTIATNPRAYHEQRIFMSKLNVVLVGILKHTWPHRWTTFVSEMVEASKSSETLCENSMEIFKLLSEEVFDFSRGTLTGAKTRELKHSLKDEFASIHQLCSYILNNSTNTRLIHATLEALDAYLSWVPIAFIFQGNLVDCLLNLFPQEAFRKVALKCLTEIGSLNVDDYGSHFVTFYKVFLHQLQQVWSTHQTLSAIENELDDVQEFVLNLASFFTTFLRTNHALLENTEEERNAFITGLQYLVEISYYEDMEVFKTCLEFWNFFVIDVFSDGDSPLDKSSTQKVSKKLIFKSILSQVRGIMMTRMAKPEEVIVVEDENGNVVRETLKDSDVLQQYKTMRETLIYLSNLDQVDTESQMLTKLRLQMEASHHVDKFSWAPLNSLCWAVGSISGTMDEEQESKFLVSVIRDLLSLCERTRGKDNKAIIASNIMCVVGQYPRFLRAHWKFLKTVVNKLFEFMHETHPGVQDMACDTFLKICSKCKAQFVMLQKDETQKFVLELLGKLEEIIQDLSPTQVSSFYEAVGMMISAEHVRSEKEGFLGLLMKPPNAILSRITGLVNNDSQSLTNVDTIRQIHECLQVNTAVCKSLGTDFMSQIEAFFRAYLMVYKQYSELISTAIKAGDVYTARSSFVKAMRSIKRAVLQLLETFIERSELPEALAKEMVPQMMDLILLDYRDSVPDARDAEVLSLFAAIIEKFGMALEQDVPRVFEAVFECTLAMITKNFEDYPEHRVNFFSLLQSITKRCHSVLFAMSKEQLTLVMNSIIWAFRHTMRNVAETGLELLEDLIFHFTRSPVLLQFYQAYYVTIMREIFSVMTDTFHKPGFKQQCKILHLLFMTVQDQNLLTGPIWDINEKGPNAFVTNTAFVADYVYNLLQGCFPNMTSQQIQVCITGMFDIREFQTFKHHLRDFLVQTKQFETQDNAELFAEEVAKTRREEQARIQNIPGMATPH